MTPERYLLAEPLGGLWLSSDNQHRKLHFLVQGSYQIRLGGLRNQYAGFFIQLDQSTQHFFVSRHIVQEI
jgi:hypothetical protein